MSKQTLKLEFGEKIYEKFPKIYRIQDEEVNFALKRYLQALGEGGFDYIIEKTNELLTFYDYAKVDLKILPHIFDSFGLPIFNGIPELYLRNLLINIGDLFERKGSKTVVEYITSIISGVKSTVEVITPTEERPSDRGVVITLEIDYDEYAGVLPDESQIRRIIEEFVPFYCYVVVIYNFIYTEYANIIASAGGYKDKVSVMLNDTGNLIFSESLEHDKIGENVSDTGAISFEQTGASAILGIGILGMSILNNTDTSIDYLYPDKISYTN